MWSVSEGKDDKLKMLEYAPGRKATLLGGLEGSEDHTDCTSTVRQLGGTRFQEGVSRECCTTNRQSQRRAGNGWWPKLGTVP